MSRLRFALLLPIASNIEEEEEATAAAALLGATSLYLGPTVTNSRGWYFPTPDRQGFRTAMS
jgi:hypothetical protein